MSFRPCLENQNASLENSHSALDVAKILPKSSLGGQSGINEVGHMILRSQTLRHENINHDELK